MMMMCTVHTYPGITRGYIRGPSCPDVYHFDLDYMSATWTYLGKLHGPTFISAKDQGNEHIPEQFIVALDSALLDPNGHHEFPDPFLDDLAVAGS